MGVHENAFIAKMGSCENALLLQKELKASQYDLQEASVQ